MIGAGLCDAITFLKREIFCLCTVYRILSALSIVFFPVLSTKIAEAGTKGEMSYSDAPDARTAVSGEEHSPSRFFADEWYFHEGSYPFFTRPDHFVVLVLVNSRHFRKSDKKRSGSRSPDTLESRTISRKNPGSLGFPGCALLALLRPVPPTLALSSQRSRPVPRPIVLDVQFTHSSPGAVGRAGDFSCFRQAGTDRSVL